MVSIYGGGACQWNICVDVRVKCFGSVAAFLIGFLSYVWVLFAGKHNLSKIIVNIVGGVIMTVLALAFMHYTVSADIEIGWYDGWSNYADDSGSGICQCNP